MASSTTSAALSARRPSTARSEASAKLKATLSAASSSDKASSQRGASGQQRSNSTSGQERASTNGSTAASSSTLSAATTPVRRTSAPDGNQARPPMQRSSTQDDSVPHTPLSHFRAEAANLPAIPLQAFAFTQSQNGVHSHTNNLEGTTGSFATGYLPSQMSAGSAPLMTSPSRSAPLPAANGSTTASNTTPSASPNGRVRSQTATPANATSPYSANGSNVSYHGSRSMRASPQMRALPQQHHGLVPSLQSLGASMLTSPSAASSGYGHSASMSATSPSHSQTHSGPHWERHTNELTSCVVAFLSPILPTEEEYRIKEATRRQLERLANRVSPGAKLLAFGSMANGFALRNSDMDLCCLMSKGEDGQPKTQHTASELVETLGQLIREETDFTVMPLPKARIPIIKITRSPTADLPYEIACDIGFENRLALENTRLLLSYAMVDPQRLRTLVLFIKVWAKRRKLNSPYTGTLSSYGYTLLVLFFLTHVKKPAVLPNLQRVPPTRIMKPEEMELNGNNIYFYDDVEELKKEWASENHENVGELLIDFFRYFSKEFSYARDVISLKSETGLLSKDSKSWNAELCIEDPFQMGYNVSRTVTKDGLYTIRGEFMRASRFLTNTRGQKISTLIAELCEEREDSLSRAPDGPGSMQRNPYHSYMGMGVPNGTSFYTASANGGRPYRDSNRRYDGNSISGYGGSFAFEQMARGLGQGVAYPPTAAMLAPLSRTHGLSPKPQHSRYAGASSHSTDAGTASFSSAQSDSGGYAPLDSAGRASIGHASARTSPSFKHAVPNGYHSSNGLGAQEAFAYGAEISFGAPSVASTRDDMGSTPRGKTSRSFSETLNRSKSLPRAPALANGHQRRAQGGASLMPHSQAGAIPTPAPATFYEPASPHSLAPSELESRMATLHVQQPSTSGPRRLSASSHASSSALFDSNSASTLHCSSASSPWSLGPAVTDGRRPSHHQQQADTHALVQEYLRRAAQSGAESTLPMDADKFAPRADHDDEDESGSVISEATLDELARLSELEGTDSSAGSPDWRGADAKQPAQREESPPRPMRLPESVLQQAKLRKHAQAAAAAAAAASSGIARKDRENAKLD
ncbi:Nucleotidyl transferase domain protein [Kalmanozyma brasiliensis GHG001]|uniref:Nucleotidyl transferase domain protein n=1 Tax=Kalmanozyma brasiliensis (strain GHG001) TaxID=1365824 RepID=UPI0028683779|nr:Nucleotidyl transferase domain protein [Kalmanozyma brasiliensis GHG001]KAF6766887.1 Nucleotidyl transferase domain protein [Kalmanozyma brasiliensis GHG001]